MYVKPVKIDAHQIYLDKQKQIFIDNYDASQNANIGVLYDVEKSKKILSETSNELEILWKSRLLYQTVFLKNGSYANAIMYYDPYKQAFTYYCDTIINYESLNILAMKYVRYFQCIDLFVDEHVLKDIDNNLQNKNVFVEYTKKDKVETKKKNIIKDDMIKNKFIYVGKMINFGWLKTVKKKKEKMSYTQFKNKYNELFN